MNVQKLTGQWAGHLAQPDRPAIMKVNEITVSSDCIRRHDACGWKPQAATPKPAKGGFNLLAQVDRGG